MKALGTVTDLSEEAAARAARQAAARARHPAVRSRHALTQLAAGGPSIDDPAATLTQIARSYDRIHTDLTSGPGALTDEQAHEALQVMVAALAHPAARPGLILTWTQVLAAVLRFDQVRDSDLEPLDVGCVSYAEAVAKSSDELDWTLFPLVAGIPSRDACAECVRVCASVNSWQTRLHCTKHSGRAL